MPSELQVSVDRDFARFGAKSYAINKINSVEVRRHYPNGQLAMFVFGLLGVICVVSGSGGGGGPLILLGLLFFVLAFWLWRRSRIVDYQLFLMTSSSEAQALTSRDPAVIQSLRERIEQAMAGQLG
jgi:hypothetical protein